MIGIDTNILVRLSIQDNTNQHQKIRNYLLRNKHALWISTNVLQEWFWVLSRIYRIEEDVIFSQISQWFEIDCFHFEDRDLLEECMNHTNKKVGFIDLLIARRNKKAGCTTTLTLDKAASALDNFTYLA